MTARTKKGYHGHKTAGADHGTAHERLMRQHTSGSRPAGAPASDQASPAPEPAEGPTTPDTAPAEPEVPEGPPGAEDDTTGDES